MYDAIISGAGPAGSATALHLARNGFRVLIVDKEAFPREKPCGEYTSPETEQVLRRLGAYERVLAAGARRLGSLRVISPSGHTLSIDYSGEGSTEGPHVLATPRTVLDAALLEHARACGAEVRERTRVGGVILEGGRAVGLALRDKSGRGSDERARLIVGADGVHSVVARSLALTRPVRWPRSLGLVARYVGHKGLDSWAEMHVSARGYAGLAPLSDGLVNVGLVMPMYAVEKAPRTSSLKRFEEFAWSFRAVAEALDGAERISNVIGVGPIGARVSRTTGAGFLLVGDAAGFFDPFTGEGVYKALRGAELAARVAIPALERNDLSARRLREYGRLRRKEFTAKDIFCRMVQAFVKVPSAMDYVVERVARRTGTRKLLTGVLGDFGDARDALTPRALWGLLRP